MDQPRFAYLTIALLGLASLGCRVTNLPAERPDDLAISLSSGGGMFPAWEWLEIEGNRGAYRERHQQAERSVEFAVPDEELDRLYRTFRENRFDCIETYERRVSDRGGTTIRLRYGSETVSVSDGGMTFIEQDWQEEYRNVRDAIQAVAERAIEAARVPVTVVLEASLVGEIVTASLNFDNLAGGPEPLAAPLEVAVRQLPGPVTLQASLRLGEREHAYLNEVVEVAAERRFTLSRDGNALRLTTSDSPP
jgi:hypothetical protein